MKGPQLKKLENQDLNEFRDELFVYLAMLFNANSKALAKTLTDFLIELQKILRPIPNNKPLKGKRK